MRVQHHLLNGTHSLDAGGLVADSLHVIRGRGRGSRLVIPNGWISVCLVLSGTLELDTQDSSWHLDSHRYQLWMEGALRCSSRNACWWLLVTGPLHVWRSAPGAAPPAIDILPWEAPCPRDVMRPLVQLARHRWFADATESPAAGEIVVALRDAVVDQQKALHTHLQRCSGRTQLRRQQTLLRLLRVQHLIRCHLDDRIELARLAASASYSPCHLIRIYRDVFGETPNEYAMRLRYQRAWSLVRTTDLSVCEIAEMLGFESESAFCRAFKHVFGFTTSVARRGQASASATTRPGPRTARQPAGLSPSEPYLSPAYRPELSDLRPALSAR